jgi:hypothetical protein
MLVNSFVLMLILSVDITEGTEKCSAIDTQSASHVHPDQHVLNGFEECSHSVGLHLLLGTIQPTESQAAIPLVLPTETPTWVKSGSAAPRRPVSIFSGKFDSACVEDGTMIHTQERSSFVHELSMLYLSPREFGFPMLADHLGWGSNHRQVGFSDGQPRYQGDPILALFRQDEEYEQFRRRVQQEYQATPRLTTVSETSVAMLVVLTAMISMLAAHWSTLVRPFFHRECSTFEEPWTDE